MPFVCPSCLTPRSLEIVAKIELPPDDRSDEVAVQVVQCTTPSCGFRGLALYEESRRGAEDSFDHTGYRLPPDQIKEIEDRILACPDPTNRRCECQTHQQLIGQPLPPGAYKDSFPMRLS